MTSTRKNKRYRITIEALDSDREGGQTMEFEHTDREDMFNVVEKLKEGSGLDASVATKMGVALRLIGPTMMEHHKHPLFADFMPHFKAFMLNLKSTVKGNQ
ncbi:DUF3861 domain-containing protein [Enterovibrio norvegicus]|uniref:DUF3861 domain-containing protein n=1 Tax=Enterovibrio norvegicus TaxID=188144 RepID=A0A2N7L540_9GAMM|nr:DUF3861 domain-containing protein [Enterovibrio norvegicus]PML76150.1 hypothetical protein BCT69_05755 [Enterovibrio norvegicus]PMN62013.1 hypothetical protein BCT27_11730 [Enterovibrio norvegicus]PMN88628.1 hypothetical protein BCT23_23935 [Enterovibrio norvegicus]